MNVEEMVRFNWLVVDIMVGPPCSCVHPVLEPDPDCLFHGEGR